MESRASAAPPEGWDEAVGALAEIDQQHRFIAEQLGRYQWRYPLLGVALGAAAASLMWHNTMWFYVVMVLFIAGILPLVGTPVRLGVVPRDSRGGRLLLFTGCMVLFVTPVVATTGPWWTDRRPSRLRAFIPYLVLILAPQAVLAPSWPNAWWPAIACGLVVAGIVVVLGRWQRVTLLASERYRAVR